MVNSWFVWFLYIHRMSQDIVKIWMIKYDEPPVTRQIHQGFPSSKLALYSICLSAFLKIHCWIEGFLPCSLCCCSAPLLWAELYKFLLVILELVWWHLSICIYGLVYGKCLVHNQASSNACIIDWRWCTVLSILVLIRKCWYR